MKKKFLAILLVLFSGISIAVFAYQANVKKTAININVGNAANSGKNNISNEIDNIVVAQQPDNTATNGQSDNIPNKTLINVPFLAQAPFGIWDALHEDACEEASFIMVKHFLDKTSLDANSGEQEIQKMIAYENMSGYGVSITLEDLNKITSDYYGLKTGRVEKNITNDDIKKELAAGHPVIVGAAGKILPNPNFRNGGPNYHMLVIKGYDSNGFITNDPGTRKGEGFRYTYQSLFNAIHDWDPGNILNGPKNYLVFD